MNASSLPRVVELVRAHDLPAALEVAEELSADGRDPTSLHHLALILHEQAFDRELLGDISSPGAFERAHWAWQKFLEHPHAFAHLPSDKIDDKALKNAIRRLRRDLVDIHIYMAAHCADADPERAAAHGRLVVGSGLIAGEREQLRCDLYLALTDGLESGDPEDEEVLGRRLEVLLHADAEHSEGLKLLLRMECGALHECLQLLVSPVAIDDLDIETVNDMEDRVALGACGIGPLQDEVDLYGVAAEEQAWMLGVWYLADAVVIRFRNPRREAVAEPVSRAVHWLQQAPELAADLLGLAQALEKSCASAAIERTEAPTGHDAPTGEHMDATPEPPVSDDSAGIGAGVATRSPVDTAERLSEAKDLIDSKEWHLAESLLLEIYPEAASAPDATGTREVIDLLNSVRSTQDTQRRSNLLERVAESIEAGRPGEALDMMRQGDMDVMLDPTLLAHRIRASSALGRLDAAADDLKLLEKRLSRTNHDVEDLDGLREQVLTSLVSRTLGSSLNEARQDILDGRHDAALEKLTILAAEHVSEPVVSWLRARAFAGAGRTVEARLAVREILAIAADDANESLRRLAKELAVRLDKEYAS